VAAGLQRPAGSAQLRPQRRHWRPSRHVRRRDSDERNPRADGRLHRSHGTSVPRTRGRSSGRRAAVRTPLPRRKPRELRGRRPRNTPTIIAAVREKPIRPGDPTPTQSRKSRSSPVTSSSGCPVTPRPSGPPASLRIESKSRFCSTPRATTRPRSRSKTSSSRAREGARHEPAGTLTEGVDYSGDRLAAAVVCGVPIVNTSSPRTKAVRRAYDDEFGGVSDRQSGANRARQRPVWASPTR